VLLLLSICSRASHAKENLEVGQRQCQREDPGTLALTRLGAQSQSGSAGEQPDSRPLGMSSPKAAEAQYVASPVPLAP